MRILVSLFMVLALVMTTSFPVVSYAMMTHDHIKAEKAESSSEQNDCHKNARANQSGKTAQNDQDSGKCCDKSVCKCVGGVCHNFSKYFGNNSNSLASLSSDDSAFTLGNQFVESALSNRLKRPPKA